MNHPHVPKCSNSFTESCIDLLLIAQTQLTVDGVVIILLHLLQENFHVQVVLAILTNYIESPEEHNCTYILAYILLNSVPRGRIQQRIRHTPSPLVKNQHCYHFQNVLPISSFRQL